MASEICTPANLYGPYEQTLFLGCSVLGFTASAGWGGSIMIWDMDQEQLILKTPSGHKGPIPAVW